MATAGPASPGDGRSGDAPPRGFLVVTVHEATGKNKDEVVVWDPSFVEGFVKVEIRGGARPVKATSASRRVIATSAAWGEDLTLPVLDGASELRLMLCREKRVGARVGTSVVAACGIFVSDILDAVPIDKFFELFKPGAGGEGGFIRVGVAFYPDARALERRAGAPRRKGGLPLLPLLLAGGVAVAAKVLAGRRRGG